ncbi:hypothetical protein [Streptomyces sp. SID10815]|uniref:hypothetical protein n=1 Tax=Streptomyces sp. SID10815 TaxID=2706027 RepID=UPI001EF2D64A|nr:hypothetical protein [Streptomyces sp. SID10815]
MHALLDTAGLAGASDAVRLAVLVLASRTPWETGVVEIRTSELGRWIGMSASYTASEVVPALKRSGVVSVDASEGEFRENTGLECKVLPLWAAQDVVGHPLNLTKKEYATLQRLLEAVMAPGWKHRDGRVTPAGLIGTRTGRAAATDRLALLLLVLEARETGRVRQCGGTVDTKRGRAAATVARMLGCTASAGERVLERLEDRELVLRVRLRTSSGMPNRSRLMVPAVAAAHGRRTVAGDVQEDRAQAPKPEFSDPDVAAGPVETPEAESDSQVSGVSVTDVTGVADPDVAAALHTDHPHLVTPVSSLTLSGGFSGEGRGGFDDLPDRACAREDQADDGEAAVAASTSPMAEVVPLRGEKLQESPADQRSEQRTAVAGTGSRPKPVGWDKAQRQRSVDLPADLRLRVALGPVSGLWARLSGWQQDQVEAATKVELEWLAGVLEQPDVAPQLLADRLTDRLSETGGEAMVTTPYGWLIGRGLVQRQACSDRRCDDGIRLDTGGDCASCASLLADRRAVRARVRTETAADLPGAGASELRAACERRLREHTVLEAERTRLRHARAVVEVARRLAAATQRREREVAAEQARRSTPCAECGLPDAAGLCPPCSYSRRTDLLVQEAVDLAVAVRADLNDVQQVAQLTARCEADTRTLIAEVCRRRGGDEVLVAYAAQEVAERVRDERRAAALRRLAESEEAMAEADAAYEAALRRRPRAVRAAEAAADDACRRAAGYLLRSRLGQLQVVRARAAAGRAHHEAA